MNAAPRHVGKYLPFPGAQIMPKRQHRLNGAMRTHDLGMTSTQDSPGLRIAECSQCGELYVLDMHSTTNYHLTRDTKRVFLGPVKECKGKPQ